MISIFAKPAFLNTASNVAFISKEKSYRGHGHLQRVSSMIRGDQIAEKLGAKLNPESSYADDVCIYVKPHIKRGVTDFTFEGVRSYIDIIDGWELLPVLEKHPEVGVIACSKKDYKTLAGVLDNPIRLIPQHHCNFERVRKQSNKIKTVGVIGTEDAFTHLPDKLEASLKERGVSLLKYSKFFSRQDIVDFYNQIDLQIVWRPYRMRLSNPLKIVNAASFGIPTIALDEEVFKELTGFYTPVETLGGFLQRLDLWKEKIWLYQLWSDRIYDKAEEYHIDKIAELYKKL